jgi:predicted ATPase
VSKHFSQIGLGNFKAFGQEIQNLPLKPITLLYGKNSSGKSSVIHSLLLLHQLLQGKNFDVTETTLGEGFVDLGGFKNYVHGKSWNKTVFFDLSFRHAPGEKDFRVELDLQWSSQRTKHFISRVSYHCGGKEFLTFQFKDATGEVQEDDFELNLADKSLLLSIGSPKWFEENAENLTILDDDFEFELDLIGSDPATNLPTKFDLSFTSKFQFPLGSLDSRALSELTNSINHILSDFAIDGESLADLTYLAGIRTIPDASFFDGGAADQENFSAGGMRHWQRIRSDKVVRDAVNKWLDVLFDGRYRLVAMPFFTAEQADQVAGEVLDGMSGYLEDPEGDERTVVDFLKDRKSEFGKSIRNLNSEKNTLRILDAANGVELTPKELGVGVSQVIPLIAAACQRDKCVMVEQPEIHLHPKQQAALADMLIENAKSNEDRFIVETHSEHLLQRILRRIGQTASGKLPEEESAFQLSLDDVGVYYVHSGEDDEESASGAKLVPVEISESGRMKQPWPDGFFSEGKEDVFWNV